jgi:hypothetical protein
MRNKVRPPRQPWIELVFFLLTVAMLLYLLRRFHLFGL